MFIGRETELTKLRSMCKAPGFQFPVLYGRRRVGKTSLLAEFSRDMPTIFFTAVQENGVVNLRNLSQEIFSFSSPDSDPAAAPVYADFQSAFEAVFSLAASRRIVFVIDEYPYLAEADPSVSSILQALIDRNKDESQLMLVLCGSSLSFMKEQVLGEKSPLYGRRTAQIELKPVDFFEALRYFPGASPEDVACYYGMVGGIPLYLRQFSTGLSVEENVERAFLDPASMLFEEPSSLLNQEVRKAPMYNSVVGAIASGKTTNNEIATTAGVSSAELSYYLRELQRIGLVERESPIVSSGRRSAYRLSDNLFSFWYRFVAPGKALIERGLGERVLARIERFLPEYMGPVFEGICADWLWRQNASGELGFEFDDLGRWWGPDPSTRREEEIDIVCVEAGSVAAVGECKWRNERVGKDVVDMLAQRASLVRARPDAERFIFSKSGFAEECEGTAKGQVGLHLVSFDDMVGEEWVPGGAGVPPADWAALA